MPLHALTACHVVSTFVRVVFSSSLFQLLWLVDSVPWEESCKNKEVHENNEILHQVNSTKQTFGDLRNRDVWGDFCRPFTHPDGGPWENWGQALNLREICSMATSGIDSFLLVPRVFKEAGNQGVDAKSKGYEGIPYMYTDIKLSYVRNINVLILYRCSFSMW